MTCCDCAIAGSGARLVARCKAPGAGVQIPADARVIAEEKLVASAVPYTAMRCMGVLPGWYAAGRPAAGNLDRPIFSTRQRVYLMLGNAGPLDSSLVHEWMNWTGRCDIPARVCAVRESLLQHLDALLAEPLSSCSWMANWSPKCAAGLPRF